MEYYLNEIREDVINATVRKHAGGKAREDVADILNQMGIQRLDLVLRETERRKLSQLRKGIWHCKSVLRLNKSLKNIKSGDVIYIQFPIFEHNIFQGLFFRHLAKKNIKIVLIIHDLTMLRDVKNAERFLMKIRLWLEEKSVIKNSSAVIVHNKKMMTHLEKIGIDSSKLINLRIFDYLVPQEYIRSDQTTYNREIKDIVIAGNLMKKKAEYIYNLPNHLTYNLYGINYEGKQNEYVCYCGSYMADELPYFLSGRFGLVWDGPSVKECIGAYGEYLKVNNPHKTSLYLACNIPVAIWNQAALAEFVKENDCGIVIESLYDLEEYIRKLSEENYLKLQKNAAYLGEKIRKGFFMKQAIEKTREIIWRS